MPRKPLAQSRELPIILGAVGTIPRRSPVCAGKRRKVQTFLKKPKSLNFWCAEVAPHTSLAEQVQQIKDRYPTATIVKEAASGAHERQVFDNLCKSLQAGDTLVVCKMDRFCRSAKEGLQYVDLLRDKGVAVHILNMGLLDNSPMGRLVATMLLAFAEFERAQIIERTQSGRQAAMAKPGFRDGRPQKFTALQVKHALGLLSEYSYKQVEAMTGISRSTLQRAKKKVEVQQ